ncbi:MAG TPA: TonB-dependent receptor [Thermoanaerobaculia bacterium]|nr:TonB-dependent receptor [Thermoanaerobaculia bacterium]
MRALRRLAAVVGALLVALAVPAAAQLQYGNLYGVVTDQDGQALPGVTVTITGVAAPLVQVTDEAGQFRFINLSPGVYAVLAELEGFSSVELPDVAVNVGARVSIEIKLTAQLSETITVTGESPLLDEKRVHRGAVVTPEELSKVPTARDPWSLLSQAPGVQVDRFNVGGNESGQQSNFLGVGSSGRDNVFAIDGVVLTDMNAVGASATYFDFGAYEEVQFTVSSTDVSVATGGVTINQVTKRGSNELKVNARYLRTDGSLQSEPSVIIDEPGTANDRVGNEIDNVQEYGADIGGPLVRDHLWLWGSYGKSDIRNLVPSAAGSARSQQNDNTELEDYNVKLNFQANSQLSGVAHYWTNDKLKFGRGAGPTRAPEATLDQTTPQDIYKVEVSWIPSSSWVFNALWARDDGVFTLAGQGGLDADVFDDENGVRRGSNFDFTQEAVIDQWRLDSHYFFNAGATSNELKFGIGFRDQENFSETVWPRGRRVIALGPAEAGATHLAVYPRDRTVAVISEYQSAWIQDTMTLDRLTITAGLRYDKQSGENLATTNPGNPQANGLLPPLDFQGNDAGGFEWETIVPRLGVTYAAGEERKTLLRGSFSRYTEQLGQNPYLFRVNPTGGYSYAYFYFTDADGDLVIDDNERGSLYFYYGYGFDPDNPGSLVTPNANDPNLDPILSDELTLGWEQGVGANFAFGATLTYRKVTDIPELRPFVVDDATGQTRLATRNDYVQDRTVTATLPNGQVVTVPAFTIRDGLTPTTGSLLTTGDREQEYTGITLSFQKRLADRWSARGHLTYADWDWKIGDEFVRFDDPTDVVTDFLGNSDTNEVYVERSGGNKASVFTGSRWSFNLNGLYQVAPDRPWGFDAGLSISGREGYPSPPLRSRVGGGPLGSRTVQLSGDLDDFRNDDVITVDAHLGKDFTFGDATFQLSIDGFNLLNEDYVLQREVDARLGRYGQVNETLSPRVFRVGAIFRWN